MEALAPKRVASAVDPSGPKVLVVVAGVAIAAAPAGVVVAAAPAGVAVAVGLAVVAAGLAAVAVLVGAVVAPDSSKTWGSRCWRRSCCHQGPYPSRAPKHLASAHHREHVAPLLPRTDLSAAFSAE